MFIYVREDKTVIFKMNKKGKHQCLWKIEEINVNGNSCHNYIDFVLTLREIF